jgi:predicted ABC-type ATPase
MGRPEFTIIAGPNGAGKSSLHEYYVTAPSFDGDKLMMQLRKQHPTWQDSWINGAVAQELQKQKDDAIARKADFAFETNFSTDMVENLVREFKSNGYKVSLCYFGLISIDESFNRVRQRKKSGGHGISGKDLRFNYYEGIKRCRECLSLFDNVTFIDSTKDYGTVVAIHMGNGDIHKVSPTAPKWYREQFQDVFEALKGRTLTVNQPHDNAIAVAANTEDILMNEAVQAIIDRITSPTAKALSDEQLETLEEFKIKAGQDNKQEKFVELWRNVTEKLEGRRGIPKQWVDDALQELRSFWNGEDITRSRGIHR